MSVTFTRPCSPSFMAGSRFRAFCCVYAPTLRAAKCTERAAASHLRPTTTDGLAQKKCRNWRARRITPPARTASQRAASLEQTARRRRRRREQIAESREQSTSTGTFVAEVRLLPKPAGS